MSKFHIVCSCTICRLPLTVQSLSKHYTKHFKKSTCYECGGQFDYNSRMRFCSRSCSTTYNNRIRPPRSEKSRSKTAESLRRRNSNLTATYGKRRTQCKVSWCEICTDVIRHKWRKTCSKPCFRELLGRQASTRSAVTKWNRGRHKQSYLEKSFEDWLITNNVLDYQTEVTFKNIILNRHYFVDFLFESKKLIVELDGTQHEKTIEHDRIRDDYLRSIGYKVVRITYKEYQQQTKLMEVMQLLNIK